mmetsp:Transcript_19895/g.56311  ORF Transcript_19895/g.56311 Transcript_19895/m.56311 type:complete len:494 (+) Transcript_19895:170-1651(+)
MKRSSHAEKPDVPSNKTNDIGGDDDSINAHHVDGSQSNKKRKKCGGRRKLRLLLHTVDGCVPFLTPSLLERYFPPTDHDDLWLGLAVRDTCITPSSSSPPPPSSSGDGTAQTRHNRLIKSTTQQSASSTDAAASGRGYSFSPNVVPDPWLAPYTRFTVPSFNLVEDNKSAADGRGKSKSNEDVTWTGDSLLIWTPNGRQAMTSTMYTRSSMGLASHHALSLYDMAPPQSGKKRQEKARKRCLTLWEDFLWQHHQENDDAMNIDETKPLTQSSSSSKLWTPVLLPLVQHEETRRHTIQSLQQAHGLAIIGDWDDSFASQIAELQQNTDSDAKDVAVLAAQSLNEILSIVESNTVNVIGSNLPARWSVQKRALIIDIDDKNDVVDNHHQQQEHPRDSQADTIGIDADGCIDVTDKRYERDADPLLPGCTCMTCRDAQFTRTYIHHLIQAKEMIADTLLFAHNLHHLLGLIRRLSTCDDLEAAVAHLRKQLRQEIE